jgi:hypothetical protein
VDVHVGPYASRSLVTFTTRSFDPTVAEKTFRLLTAFSTQHKDIHCIAVSHSSRAVTEQWILDVGGAWEVEVIVDEGRDLYAAWGLGLSSAWHALGPSVLWSAYSLGRSDGIWNRATGEGGSRWQTSGAFAIDQGGIVRWAQVAASADQVPDFEVALKELERSRASGG